LEEPRVGLRISPATEEDVPLVFGFVRKLAEFERAAHRVTATEDDLREGLFGARPVVEALIAHLGDTPAGFALFYPIFSTFSGRRGIYLEDLFVDPEHRGRGVGKALLSCVEDLARERGCDRLQWSVLNWNQHAIDFYKSIGAAAKDEWTVYHLALSRKHPASY
jgi:GNAT superfamily N-acetyltransferase